MRNRYKILLTAALCAMVASLAQAVEVISYNFDNNGTVGGVDAGSYPKATSYAGVVNVAYWYNNWPNNPNTDLTNSVGVETTMDISWASFNTYAIQGSHPGVDEAGTWNKEMLNGYLNSGDAQSPAQSSVTLSQIPYQGYDVYVYFGSDDASRSGSVTDGTTTFYFNVLDGMIAGTNAVFVQATDTNMLYYEANYAVFSNLTGASKTITCHIPLFGGISAIQVVENTNALFGFAVSPENAQIASKTVTLEATVTEGIATFQSAELFLDNVSLTNKTTRDGVANYLSYVYTSLSSGTHTARVDAVAVGGATSSYEWTFEGLPFGTVTVSPTDATTNDTVDVEVVVIEGTAAVDTGSVSLTVDGTPVSSLAFVHNAPTTTITGVASSLSIGTHTGQVVFAGNPDGSYSNDWTFAVSPLQTAIPGDVISWNLDEYGTVGSRDGSYSFKPAGVVLAANWNNSWETNPTNNLMDNSGASTTLDIQYQSFNEWRIQGSNPGADSDGTFNKELLNGYLSAGPAGWNPPTTNSSVTLSEIPFSTYDIYVYVSSDVSNREYYVTDGATTYYAHSVGPASIASGNATFALASDTTSNGYWTAANYAVFSGLSGAGQTITCQFRDTDEWGGIAGIQVVNTSTGPSVVPDVQSIAVAGGTATLIWASESGATYTIQSKSALTAGSWIDKKPGIPSAGDGTTSDSVPAAAGEEFYRIKAE